jgi:cell division protein FtsA
MVSLTAIDAAPSDPPRMIPRAHLVRIIRPRVEEILEMVRDRLAASPFAADPRGRVILTGGASQLTGLSDLATQMLGRQVRIGRPLGVGGLTDATKGPAFAAAAGLLVYPQFAYLEHCEPRKTRQLMTGTDGYFTRVGRWFRESF